MQNIDDLDKPHGYTERLEVLIDDVDSIFDLTMMLISPRAFNFIFCQINFVEIFQIIW